MHYREYLPSPHLAPIVHCLWTLEGHASELAEQSQPVVPDGRTELILHFGDPFDRLYADGSIERQAPVLFAGQLTSSLVLRPTGRIGVLGVRLHAHGAAALLRAPQHEFAGLTLGIADIDGGLSRSLSEVRDSARSLTDAVRAVQDTLSHHADPPRVDPRIAAVAQTIQQRRGLVSIEQLATEAGLTRRHLERRFMTLVGVPPKRLARIVRLQHALHVLEQTEAGPRGALTAAACGYADQAHFIRECQEVCGHPPGTHLLQRGELTGFFMD
jgi:AraC-like DNA-binding protein